LLLKLCIKDNTLQKLKENRFKNQAIIFRVITSDNQRRLHVKHNSPCSVLFNRNMVYNKLGTTPQRDTIIAEIYQRVAFFVMGAM